MLCQVRLQTTSTVLPVADERIWTTTLASATDGPTDAGIEYGGVPFPATATFGDVMQADATPHEAITLGRDLAEAKNPSVHDLAERLTMDEQMSDVSSPEPEDRGTTEPTGG